ncbi:MAG: ABC transporter permease [Tepidanaerobacteraceae bacterium]|jgi:ABC-2 type transport system permease protein|nr:ABC transporter permease [Tepidanaerobacteraceae bacterium]
MFNLRRVLTIIKKEFIHIKRDRASLAIAIMMPLVMMLLFGYAVKVEVDHVPTAVWDENRSQQSRNLINAYKNSNYFDVNYYVKGRAEMLELLDMGNAKAALHIPPEFDRKIMRGETAQAEILIDGSDPTVARTVFSSGLMIAENFSRKISVTALLKKGASISPPPVDVRPRMIYNPTLRAEIFTIPGLIGLVMQNITIMLTAFALVRERERGTIEQLIVTPIKPAELIVGKLIPYIFIAFIDFAISLSLGVFLFKVPVKGSLMLLLLLAMVFIIVALSIGILISTIARTQLQAMQMTVLTIMPSIILSGFIFPLEAMPYMMRWASYIIPVTYFMRIMRGIVVKGVVFSALFHDTLILALMGFVLFALAIFRFRKKLE